MTKKIIFLVLLSAATYSNTLFNSFIWDEVDIIKEDVYTKSAKYIPYLFSPTYWQKDFPVTTDETRIYRPLWILTFLMDYKLWGFNPLGWHLTNIILYIICAVTLYLFLFFIFKNNFVPFLSTIIFIVYPAHVEAVAWMKNRSNILCCIFCLLSFIFFVKNANPPPNNPLISKYPSILISVLCFMLALLSKEVAVALPIILVLYVYLFVNDKKNLYFYTIPYFIIALLFSLFMLKNKALSEAALGISPFASFRALGEYTKIMLFPFWLCIERILDFSVSIVISFFIFGCLIYFYKAKAKDKLFFLLWFLVSLMPVLNVSFVSSRPIAEHRLFIPSVGFCVVLGIYAGKLWHQQYFKIIFYAVISIMCIFSFNRNFVWKDTLSLWQNALKQGCETERVYTNLAVGFEEKNMLDKAMASYTLALKYSANPKSISKIYTNIAILYEKSNQLKESVEYLKKAFMENPDYLFAHKLLARIYEKQGLYKDALVELQNILAKNKNDFDAYNTIGVIYAKEGDLENAKKFYEKALEVFPDFKECLVNLGMLHYWQKKYDLAIDCFKKARDIDKNYLDALNKLAITYDTIGEKEKAVKIFKDITYKFLDYIPAHFNLVEIYTKDKKYFEALAELKLILSIEPENKTAIKKELEIKEILKNEQR
ncbi:MAG TPA: hypothetical protein DCX95_03825 [Elusimicrobia bacterium]|nr:hypothetical protein [Elusimicrobiota bacterium]